MLGLGWYVWDERCPSGGRCVPPLYGNFGSTYIKVPENSPRTNGRDQAEAESAPWKARTPRGKDICIKYGSGGNKANAASLKKRSSPKQSSHHHSPSNEIFARSNTNNNGSCNPQLYFSTPCTSQHRSTGCNDNNRNVRAKKFYNIMWDPKIARGPTTVQFEEAQRAKWKRQVDSHRAILAREQIRRRRKKKQEEQYLDTKSNPMRQLVYPTVTISKEPLTNSSFASFLTEQCEAVERKNEGQVTDDAGGPPHGQNKKSFYSGISAGVQTDEDGNKRQETEDWIASTMIETIPQQVVLELQEEAELEVVKGEQKRYELVFLYRKWQESKENQWKEYLYAWNELRMREILDQDAYLQEQQERIVVIGFCRNAIGSCFQTTFERMKQDGFINKQGVPYGELEELNDSLDYRDEAEEKFAERNLVARKVVDSALINSVVQRFSRHMFDDYGKPHGTWLSKRGRRESIDYDLELQSYLESRWLKRREHPLEHPSANALYSETSLLDIFDFYKGYPETKGTRPTLKEGHSYFAIENLISKQRLGRRFEHSISRIGGADNKNDMDGHHHHHEKRSSNNDVDVSMLYKRHTATWTKLEMDDHYHHQSQKQLQKSPISLGNSKRGSRLVSDAKLTRVGTIGKSRGGDDRSSGVPRFLEERKEVDRDKLGDGESENRRTKLSPSSVAKTESRRQSQAPHARFL